MSLPGATWLEARKQSHATTGQNAIFDGRSGCVQGIFDTSFLFFHFALGCRTDVNFGNATGQLGQPFFQFFAVVVARCVVDFASNLVDPAFDFGVLAGGFDDRRFVLANDDLLGATQFGQSDRVEFHTEGFENSGSACQNRDVFHHRFASVTVARSLDRTAIECATQPVDDQSRQCFAFDVFGNDQAAACFAGRPFPAMGPGPGCWRFSFQKSERRRLRDTHSIEVGIIDEVRRQVTAIELHPFDPFDFGLAGFCLHRR